MKDEFDIQFGPIDYDQPLPEASQQPSAAPVANVPAELAVTIDLEDGSGVQVFKGATQQELIDKLTDAQKNATKKIRELNQLVSQPQQYAEPQYPQGYGPAQDFSMQPRQMSPDEEYWLAQEFASGRNPLGAFRAMTEAVFGAKPEDISNFLAAQREKEAYNAVENSVDEFRTIHAKDYYPCEKNMNLMVGMLQRENRPPSPENLEYAFSRLNANGLLEPIPAETTNANEGTRPPVQQTSKRVAQGGISDRGQSTGTFPSKGLDGLTDEDVYNMDTDELKRRIEWQHAFGTKK